MSQKNKTSNAVSNTTEAIVTPVLGFGLGLLTGLFRSGVRGVLIVVDEIGKPIVAKSILGAAKAIEEGKKFQTKHASEQVVESSNSSVTEALTKLRAATERVASVEPIGKVVDAEFEDHTNQG